MMRDSNIPLIFVFVLLVGFFLTNLALARESEIYKANRQLIDLRRELQAEKRERLNDKIDLYNRRKDLEGQIRGLEREGEDLRIEVLKLENELLTLENNREELERELELLRAEIDEVHKFMLGRFDQLIVRAASLFPSRKKEKMEGIEKLVERYGQRKNRIREGLRELFKFIQKEIYYGKSIEFYQGTLELPPGESDFYQILRIGRVGALALTSDGARTGILLRREESYEWDWGLAEKTRQKISDLFQALQRGERDLSLVVIDVTVGRRMEAEIVPSEGVIAHLKKGGPVMIPLLLVGLVALFLIIERFFYLRKNQIDPDTLMDKLDRLLKEKRYPESHRLLEETSGPLARLLKVGLDRREGGRKAVEESMEQAALTELPPLSKFLSTIGILGTISPLLGLLGTVTGMISTFEVITRFGSGEPRLLSGGISEALITTEVGLAIAIPVLLLHNHLSSRIERITAEIEKCCTQLINTLFP